MKKIRHQCIKGLQVEAFVNELPTIWESLYRLKPLYANVEREIAH